MFSVRQGLIRNNAVIAFGVAGLLHPWLTLFRYVFVRPSYWKWIRCNLTRIDSRHHLPAICRCENLPEVIFCDHCKPAQASVLHCGNRTVVEPGLQNFCGQPVAVFHAVLGRTDASSELLSSGKNPMANTWRTKALLSAELCNH